MNIVVHETLELVAHRVVEMFGGLSSVESRREVSLHLSWSFKLSHMSLRA